MERKNIWKLLILTIMVSLMFLSMGCATIQPLTVSIVQQIGEERLDEFQYYLSKTITLTHVVDANDADVKGGVGVISSKTIRDKIIIPASLPGIAENISPGTVTELRNDRGNFRTFNLKISFENEGETIQFNYIESDDKFYFNEFIAISFGGVKYEASYSGDDIPYLLIKLKGDHSEENSSRTLKGRKLK